MLLLQNTPWTRSGRRESAAHPGGDSLLVLGVRAGGAGLDLALILVLTAGIAVTVATVSAVTTVPVTAVTLLPTWLTCPL